MTRWEQTWPATALLTPTALCAAAGDPKRVLMVFLEDSRMPATRLLEQGVLLTDH